MFHDYEHAIAQLEHAVVDAQIQGLKLALKSMKKEDVFPYFIGLAKNTGASDLISIAKTAVHCEADSEVREQLKPMAMIEATIAATPELMKEHRHEHLDHVIRELIVMSAMLFNKCCEEMKWFGDTTLAVTERGLRLYNLMWNDQSRESELAEKLLENCGAILDQEDIKAIKANLKNLVEEEEKHSMAYEVMSRGYLKYNSLCHLASESLWREGLLSRVSSTVPDYDILETLKQALTAVNLSEPETLKTAELIYHQFTNYFGSQKAMEIVMFARPDLAGEF